VRSVFDAMEWLGLKADEEPVYQSGRRSAHLSAAEQLLSRGLAYPSEKGQAGQGEAVVFRMPQQTATFHDEIKGELSKPVEGLEDFVIVRSNGTPVFHLANVLDDIEMGITHVIRGDDHVENTFRHVALYRALGAPVPRFAHLPMIVNREGKPYAKRDGDAYVGDFRAHGFLPDALFNYLVLLGWSPGDDREVMPREEIVRLFTLDRVKSSSAQMDLKKLEWMNGEYIRSLPEAEFAAVCRAQMTERGLWTGAVDEEYFLEVVRLLQPRVKRTTDFVELSAYFFADTYPFDEKAVRKRLRKPGALDGLALLKERYQRLEPFTAQTAEEALRALAEERDLNPGQLVHPARVAVSGLGGGPGLFDMLALIGRERVVHRMDRALRTFSDDGGDAES
jgi:glutamyl-tRNA synthetase